MLEKNKNNENKSMFDISYDYVTRDIRFVNKHGK